MDIVNNNFEKAHCVSYSHISTLETFEFRFCQKRRRKGGNTDFSSEFTRKVHGKMCEEVKESKVNSK